MDECKVFVGSISWNTTDESLREFFEAAGVAVTSAKVMTDRDTGRSRGFGFVEFETQDDLEKAVALDGQELDGRALKIDKARPREERRF